jgi:hypothetical protein
MRSEYELRMKNEALRKRRMRGVFTILNSQCIILLLAACASLPAPQQQSAFPSPVAFVTAAPLQEPTATPTLVPLPTNTVVPATAVPKRLPQESTATIGLWSDRVSSVQPFGFLDLAQGSAAADYKAQRNQLMVMLSSAQVYTAPPEQLADLQTNKPDWLLFDRNKRVARSTEADAPLLDIRTEAVRTQLAENVAAVANATNIEGVVLRNVGVDLVRTSAAPIFTGTKAFTDDQRRDAVEGLLRTIRARVPDKLLIVGGYAWRDGTAYAAKPEEAQNLATFADGVHVEAFLRSPISKTTEFKSEANWKRDVDFLSAISQDNKVVLLTTRLETAGVTTDVAGQWLNYTVASYLLGKNGAHTYLQFDAGDPAFSNDLVLSAPIGAPTEAYTKLDSGIYQRTFSKGIVLVNPTNDSKKTTLQGNYKTLSGNQAEASITLGPRTGVILLRN